MTPLACVLLNRLVEMYRHSANQWNTLQHVTACHEADGRACDMVSCRRVVVRGAAFVILSLHSLTRVCDFV